MKKIAFVIFIIVFACSCNNKSSSNSNNLANKAFMRDLAASELSLAFEILQSSAEYKSDTDGLREAIIANGGSGFTITLEGSPYGELDGVPQSNRYIFAIQEEYEERTTITKRYSYDPENKQLLKYDAPSGEYYPIQFDRSIIEY